jgi:serine/threonine-protein kinase RsbW
MLSFSDHSHASPTLHHAQWQRSCNTVRLSSLQEMPALIDRVARSMRELGYLDRDIFGLQLALDEAVTNAIKHGNRNDPGKSVKIRYAVNDECTLIEVADEGPGFDPALVPDPTSAENLERTGGRGLLLIHFYMSWVRYNKRGNAITFCKYPSTPLNKSELDSHP